MTSKLIIAVLLQIAGVAVIFAEILIPSAGILAIIALGLLGYSLFYIFSSLSMTVGIVFLIADAIIIPIALIFGVKLLAKSPLTLKSDLSSEDGVTSQDKSLDDYLGKSGVAESDLRPSGVARIDGKRLDVVTRGEYIEKETEITILSVTANQLVVCKKQAC